MKTCNHGGQKDVKNHRCLSCLSQNPVTHRTPDHQTLLPNAFPPGGFRLESAPDGRGLLLLSPKIVISACIIARDDARIIEACLTRRLDARGALVTIGLTRSTARCRRSIPRDATP